MIPLERHVPPRQPLAWVVIIGTVAILLGVLFAGSPLLAGW